MSEEVSKGQIQIRSLVLTQLFRLPNALKKLGQHLFKDVMMFDLCLHDESDRCEEIFTLEPRIMHK